VGQLVNGSLLDPNLAYLTSDTLVRTPWATPFEVETVLPYQEKIIKRWLREHEVGVLEIKKRGLEVDPAQLRRRLGLRGGEQRTLILTRTPRAALAVVAQRLLG
jgi:hypothetical protein